MVIRDLVSVLEQIAPAHLAEAWDKIGLQVGSPDEPVKGILVALDPIAECVDFCVQQNLNVLITHHPFFFKPFGEILFDSTFGKILQTLLSRRIALFVMHTNFDSAWSGINSILAARLDLQNVTPLQLADDPQVGLGRIGDLKTPLALERLVREVKRILDVEHLRFVGNPNCQVSRLALCSGSGADFILLARRAGAQCHLTGDIKYHQALDAHEAGFCLIDPGHFSLEALAIPPLAEYIRAALIKKGMQVPVQFFKGARDPFSFT